MRGQSSSGFSRCHNLLTALLLFLLIGSSSAPADDWPQWRGPNRDGVWSESGIVAEFPPGGLEVRWRAPAGYGFSSPVVAQGRVYCFDAELAKPKATERVRCFDANTGKILWSFSHDVNYPDWAFTESRDSGPYATPIVQNDRLFTEGLDGDIFCFDAATGEILWRRNTRTDYQVEHYFLSAPSPLIDGNLLILLIGGKPGACVVALDKNSGKEIWRALDDKTSQSSPIVITAAGKKQLLVWTDDAIVALDPATGNTHWRQRMWVQPGKTSTPVAAGDLLFVGGLMLRLGAEKPGATILWPDKSGHLRKVLSDTSTALIQGSYLYSAKSSGEFVCIEAASGKEVWTTDKVTDLLHGASVHITTHGADTFLYTDKGELILARLSPDGYREISRARLLEPTHPFEGRKLTWPAPAYANRCIFVRNEKEIICASLAGAVHNPDVLDEGASATPNRYGKGPP